jgi:pyruvate kinase
MKRSTLIPGRSPKSRAQPRPGTPLTIRQATDPLFDRAAILLLTKRIQKIRNRALAGENRFEDDVRKASPGFRPSTRNLLHYLALREEDLRELQHELTLRGLTSLGRCDSHVMDALESLLGVLARLLPSSTALAARSAAPVDLAGGAGKLRRHAELLFGPPPKKRAVRIMVTMPTEAAQHYQLVRDLMATGMEVARINCAHDEPRTWQHIIRHVRRAEKELGSSCRILMDLAGPKLRTGAVEPGARVAHFQPERDARGAAIAPAEVLLHRPGAVVPVDPDIDAVLPVLGDLVNRMAVNDELRFVDCRRRPRLLRITAEEADGVLRSECLDTTYVEAGTPVELLRRGMVLASSCIGELPAQPQPLILRLGQTLWVTTEAKTGHNARPRAQGRLAEAASIPCTLEAVFRDARAGQRILFDDGKIEGVIRAVQPHRLRVIITRAAPQGSKLRPEKGINLPDTELAVPALSAKDLQDLRFAVKHADIASLSFVNRPEDVLLLRKHLAKMGRPNMAVVLKIETLAAYRHLPGILLAGMQSSPLGIMVARGDLAVEAGLDHLSELQEDILWICEAAHIPVIWATQVLEGLAKKGLPSRAEVTDAAMSGRAECVMLNKGPHILAAMRFLNNVLLRMQQHQYKKRDLLRRLSLHPL